MKICLTYQACAVVHPVYGMLTWEATTVTFDAVTFPELLTNNLIEEMFILASYQTLDNVHGVNKCVTYAATDIVALLLQITILQYL